ncbi:FYV4 [Candida pseudojiufengensis]|uniref:FYV4 n=1 Tax=Candida pseudojiufengensis TaxID=497109 RepID=UPI0022244087|nr:FYV4 [Candida pseudojiufengensis]KAI5966336.1 FYV4 [Candida pseudojiufengensis]
MFRSLIRTSFIQPNSIIHCTKPLTKPAYQITYKFFSQSSTNYKTNTSTRTKENVHDLKTFLELIGRNCVEHLDAFEGDLNKFIETPSKKMKEIGIDTRTRRYLLRWKHKFVNNLEPLREHKRGKKKNGGERKAKTVIAKRKALQRLEDKEKFSQEEMDAENRGERLF